MRRAEARDGTVAIVIKANVTACGLLGGGGRHVRLGLALATVAISIVLLRLRCHGCRGRSKRRRLGRR